MILRSTSILFVLVLATPAARADVAAAARAFSDGQPPALLGPRDDP